MASKIKMMKLVQELRGFAELTNRRPQGHPGAALALALRLPNPRPTTLRRKRTITIHMHESPDIPHPVSIKQL